MAVGVDVVIESVFNRGADAELDAGEELLESFGEQVSGAVPEGVFAFGVVPFEKAEGSVIGHGAAEVPLLTVDRCGEHVLCQPGADRLSYLQRGNARFELLDAPVGECNIDHF